MRNLALIAALFIPVLSVVLTPTTVGKQRTPITGPQAAGATVLNLVAIAAILHIAGWF